MGFLDKAKAAATELAAKADGALASSGMAGPAAAAKQADRAFRDLGVLAYLNATGRPADESARERLMHELRAAESQGGIASFALHSAAPPPPGMAGTSGYAAPPPPAPGMAGSAGYGGYAAPPPPGAGMTPPPPPPGPGPGPSAAPPPPPPAPADGPPPAPAPDHSPVAPPPPPPWATGTSS
ncbi:MAG: hypothetical protein KBF43_04470 [Dermatophilaceae bacterium]|nr:hypothetical protein [Actinomycetales bacterium]MBP8880273.1 hypothetical protein [Dermatophilaceae bacterium]MBP9917820.1 hypothetical protein [Dermatophilaceae bacterium]